MYEECSMQIIMPSGWRWCVWQDICVCVSRECMNAGFDCVKWKAQNHSNVSKSSTSSFALFYCIFDLCLNFCCLLIHLLLHAFSICIYMSGNCETMSVSQSPRFSKSQRYSVYNNLKQRKSENLKGCKQIKKHSRLFHMISHRLTFDSCSFNYISLCLIVFLSPPTQTVQISMCPKK